MNNLFYMLDKSGRDLNEAWNYFCIGSDLDGMIDPIDIVATAARYPYMRDRLEQFIPVFLELSDRDYKDYFPNDCLKENLNKLFYDNLKNFVVENFTSE